MSRCIHETRIRYGYDADTTSIRTNMREYSVSIVNYPKIDSKLPLTPVREFERHREPCLAWIRTGVC